MLPLAWMPPLRELLKLMVGVAGSPERLRRIVLKDHPPTRALPIFPIFAPNFLPFPTGSSYVVEAMKLCLTLIVERLFSAPRSYQFCGEPCGPSWPSPPAHPTSPSFSPHV